MPAHAQCNAEIRLSKRKVKRQQKGLAHKIRSECKQQAISHGSIESRYCKSTNETAVGIKGTSKNKKLKNNFARQGLGRL
jgi:hypothetical protein